MFIECKISFVLSNRSVTQNLFDNVKLGFFQSLKISRKETTVNAETVDYR